jgi:hypothetical protein
VEIRYDSEGAVKNEKHVRGRDRQGQRERKRVEMKKVTGTECSEKLYILLKHLSLFSVLFLQNSRHKLAIPQ